MLGMKGQDPPVPVVGSDSQPDRGQAGSMFQVEGQAQQAPVIAVSNGTDFDLRLMLQDSNGLVKTEWIGVGGSKQLTIPEGYYQATIEAPDDSLALLTHGTVEVKDFHHYQANFVLVPAIDPNHTFYIGD
jgi:hypothetical protein